jgi:hypothetical protein
VNPEDEFDNEDWSYLSDKEWSDICAAGRIDPIKRDQSRAKIISHENAMDCTIFRLSEDDNDDGCIDLCDAKILFIGKHQVPEGLDEEEFEDLYGDLDINLLVDAWLEYLPNPDDLKAEPEPPDMVSVEPGGGIALPFQLIDFVETEEGRRCILLNCIDQSGVLES